ncbi:O-methyltransferase [Flavobacteriaceae bacterium]|nr:O-methyltransferase [Flavobacteriaceae bacterium]MDB4591271.1 O-methyltransferase [Flavobacteriaceae bacterium]MDB9780254.1 O-methyltransferase [bacterium]|tara:strand:+ start:14889 stop:15530 length:642 start_codon:yes stop_codon:yes gene_type:complete
MHFLPEKLDDYVVAHSQKEPELLQQLSRETWQKVLAPRMLSGHFQGRVLSMVSKLINPKNVLEIGTYTGYSALCLVEGIQPKGQLHTIDTNEELYDLQRKYFDKSGFGNQIIQHTGNALNIIPTIDKTFDLVFIDADKQNYPNYLEIILPKLKSGSVILSDNVLWTGKVIEKIQKGDKDTEALLKYNKMINEHSQLETVLLPIRDGLTLTRVK